MKLTHSQKLLRKRMRDVLIAGAMCSNCCYNLGQHGQVRLVQHASDTQSLRDSAANWDKAISRLPKWIR